MKCSWPGERLSLFVFVLLNLLGFELKAATDSELQLVKNRLRRTEAKLHQISAEKERLQARGLKKETPGHKRKSRSSEEGLYVKVLEDFQFSRQKQLEKHGRVLRRGHPHSLFADNSLFLEARLLFQEKHYAETLQRLRRLDNFYPKSDRRVAGLFLKAMTYKALNLNNQSREVLQKVVRMYPGSPEAVRSQFELRLIETQ